MGVIEHVHYRPTLTDCLPGVGKNGYAQGDLLEISGGISCTLRPKGKPMSYTPLDKPESVARVFVEAWARRDAEKLASLFDEDAEFVNVTGLWWHDRQAILKAHAYGFEHIFGAATLHLTWRSCTQRFVLMVKPLCLNVGSLRLETPSSHLSSIGSQIDGAACPRRTLISYPTWRQT